MSHQLLFETIQYLNEYIDHLKHNPGAECMSVAPELSVADNKKERLQQSDRMFATKVQEVCESISKELSRFEHEIKQGCGILEKKLVVLEQATTQ